MLHHVVWWKFTEVSEVLAAFSIGVMSVLCMRNWFELRELVGQGKTLGRPVCKCVQFYNTTIFFTTSIYLDQITREVVEIELHS
jgi:hypothetical protein